MIDDETAVRIEAELATVLALADGKYGDSTSRAAQVALELVQGTRPTRTCNWVARSRGGNETCRTNPVFSDDFWAQYECPFCGRKVDALVEAERVERAARQAAHAAAKAKVPFVTEFKIP